MMAPSIYKAKGVMELARERVGGSSANRFGGAFALSEYEKIRRGGKAGGPRRIPPRRDLRGKQKFLLFCLPRCKPKALLRDPPAFLGCGGFAPDCYF